VSVIKTALMAQWNTTVHTYSGKKVNRVGAPGVAKHNPKIDMTPMVDLGFLLISFFVITTELSKPTAMDLFMPKESKVPMELGELNALTVLLDKDNRAWCYHGRWEDAVIQHTIIKTGFSGNNGLRKNIIAKQQWLDNYNKKEGRNGLMLVIKPGSGASYKNVVDVLDEVSINGVKKYAVVKMSEEEMGWLEMNI